MKITKKVTKDIKKKKKKNKEEEEDEDHDDGWIALKAG